MSPTTPRSALPLLAAAQSQKHVTHNEALLKADALLGCNILDRDLSAPPATPADGDTYLVKATGTAAWAGQDGNIAFAVDGGWRFYTPYAGLVAYVADEQKLVVFNGSTWLDYASLLALQNVPELGVNAAADSTNKFTVASAAVLFNNVGNGVQAKLNKNASADSASLLYQTNFAGRAEIGLTGDDNFHFKVSPDGSTFYEALILNRNTGSQLLKHVDVSAATTLGATHLGRMVRADATGGAFNVTLPASADADDWVIVRKKDSTANRVLVQTTGGTALAWLSAQYDEVMLAFWDGAWSPVRWNIAPIKDIFTANGTWTKPPLLKFIEVVAFAGGNGGGSGRRGAAGTARAGGQGGSGGSAGTRRFAATDLSGAESVTVGAGGNGGAAQTGNDTDGNGGSIGGASSFGTHMRVSNGASAAGDGGTNAAKTGPSNAIGVTFNYGSPGNGGNSAIATAGGAGSGSAMTAGGGAGGGISTADAALSGGAGAAGSQLGGTNAAGGTAGTAGGSGPTAGADIASTVDQTGGGGGGGGAGSTTGAGQNGAAGGAPGGGGGGGGASLNGNNSGAGGNGARGEVRVTTYF